MRLAIAFICARIASSSWRIAAESDDEDDAASAGFAQPAAMASAGTDSASVKIAFGFLTLPDLS
ncbi:hypothetical protein [Sphingomonas sp. IC081]|uniref:hypothetical protein n=1 Tax=Sphingomonas sp. IC081 TaxID=304378 RepID=UPI0021B0684A|nr:hypothetical protein [Sphingomonas sp. IC081]